MTEFCHSCSLEGKKSLKTFDFDVSSERVSIHIPIVRFLAGESVVLVVQLEFIVLRGED